MGIRAPRSPRLQRVAEPGPAVSAASRLSRSPPLPRPPARPPARPAAVPLGGRCSASQGGCSRRRIPATPTDGSISTSARPPDTRIGPRCANGRAAQPMRRHRSRQSRGFTGPPPSPARDPGVPAPGHPSSSPPLAVLSPGAGAPNQADPQSSPKVFSGDPDALASPLLGRALRSRIPRPTAPCSSAQDWDVPKERLWARTWGTEGAGPVRDPGRSALYWLRPGRAQAVGSLGKEDQPEAVGGLFPSP